jgi:hypothetical protein
MRGLEVTVRDSGFVMRLLQSCLTFLAALAPVTPTIAQVLQFELEVDAFPVIRMDGVQHDVPFFGGLDQPIPQLVDVDADGDLDLFVQEELGAVMHLENVGTSRSPTFEWRTGQFEGIDVRGWYHLADVDGDDDIDLLTQGGPASIRLYLNEGTRADPEYRLAFDVLTDTDGQVVESEPGALPFVYDVDCDDLPDLMLGRLAGTISRYEFQPRPSPLPPNVVFVEDRYQGIEIISGGSKRLESSLHGANALAFHDMDLDGAPDLLWGDFFEQNVIYLESEGTCQNTDLQRRTSTYMRDGTDTLWTSGFNAPRPSDLDGDGFADLLVGVLGGAFVPATTSVENLYLLKGSPPTFELQTRRLLSGIDVTSESTPTVGDVNNDGLLDLLIGDRVDPATASSPPVRARLHYLAGTSQESVSFTEMTDDFLGLTDGVYYAPALGDVDGDGDDDLVVGAGDGTLRFLENDGRREEISFFRRDDVLAGIDVGSNSAPAIADIDGDGDADLLVGTSVGSVELLENVDETGPTFERRGPLAGVGVGQFGKPAAADVDGDGDTDLFVGTGNNGLFLYTNESSESSPLFTSPPAPVEVLFARYLAPATADPDRDGDIDLFVGGRAGGLAFYRNTSTGVGREQPSERAGIGVHLGEPYPNPAEDRVWLRVSGGPFPVVVTIFDTIGRQVDSQHVPAMTSSDRALLFDLTGWPVGLYVVAACREAVGGTCQHRAFVRLRADP